METRAVAPAAGLKQRFTLDGSDALEARLESLCQTVVSEVGRLIPPRRWEAILLGGGYGRGEGGVLRTEAGEQPYNDLEFYLFLRGPRLLSEPRYGSPLEALGARLSGPAGLHVEFKITSARAFQKSVPSLFSYDLVMGHRLLEGCADFLRDCSSHRAPHEISSAEAARLLMNRGSGLLFARRELEAQAWTPEASDFVRRNIEKARLALGDAVLAAHGQYHWSCRERARRVETLRLREPWWPEVQHAHAQGVEFKLHPTGGAGRASLWSEHHEVSALAEKVWLWLENRRLGTCFQCSLEYALDPRPKLIGNALRHRLVTLRHFGVKAFGLRGWGRYPRERLFHSLAILLWNEPALREPRVLQRVQAELGVSSRDASGLAEAHRRLWQRFG